MLSKFRLEVPDVVMDSEGLYIYVMDSEGLTHGMAHGF